MKLLLHDKTQTAIAQFVAHPSHALLLEGLDGMGKGTVAAYIASQILGTTPEKLANYPYYLLVEPDGNSISIDTIRGVQRFMHLKTLGRQQLRRVLVIENAQAMTIEAQNAFLKLLEEPPADTVILMSVANPSNLLPTIRSRVQVIRINAPPEDATMDYFVQNNYKSADIQRAYHISQGRPGLMQAVLEHDSTHSLVAQIEIAKKLLAEPLVQRLAQVDELAKKKDELGELMRAIQLVCHAALVQASQREERAQIKRWHHSLAKLSSAQDAYVRNVNPKLLLSDLLINL